MILQKVFNCIALFSFLLMVRKSAAADEEQLDGGRFQNIRNVEFDWILTKQVFAEKSNAVISPFLVKLMLVLLYEATGVGEISGANPLSTELRLVLEPNGDLQDTRTNYQQLLESVLKSDSMYDVRLDTKFFLDDFIDVASKYELIVEHFYNASAENVPFSKPREAVEVINDWANSVTQGRINKLVSEADITNSVIALASIASFKGQWKSPFPASNTRQGIFNGVQVDYMQQIDLLYYDDSTTLGAQLLRMPYQGGKFAMFFMLPHQNQTVDDVLSRITPQVLHQALWYMDELDVNVTIPKFKFDFSVQLSESLQKIGIREIFSMDRSLPLLARGKGARDQVRISQVLQKVGITVDETGSDASVAGGITLTNKVNTVPDGLQLFNANRPFAFFIEDEATGLCLFAGKVENPTQL
ncbi:serine protease inhibitor 2-like [Culex pipiens pallens]|uniref:serine protease inhibitor 2-like n=1 Tax=Culex pipiens pallens TaxID=42434 RepID=UPI001954E6A3|nr:serine protease inhibitor 2-like [Culex pipiens pallens]